MRTGPFINFYQTQDIRPRICFILFYSLPIAGPHRLHHNGAIYVREDILFQSILVHHGHHGVVLHAHDQS